MRGQGTKLLAIVVGLCLWVFATSVRAERPEKMFEEAVEALSEGDHGQAIVLLEALADRGFNHPDVAYNRGVAYLARVRAKQGRPGDLGRAAAGFEEALLGRPGDAGAFRALELVRAEVARTGARSGRSEVEVKPSLDRIIVGFAPEAVWAWAALISSLVLTVGLVLRRAKSGAIHMTGTIAAPIGLIGLLLFGSLAGRARHLRWTTIPAVVVVSEARILDEHGSAMPQEDPIPEAARVDVLERRGTLARVRHGQREGWTHGTSLRQLGLPRL